MITSTLRQGNDESSSHKLASVALRSSMLNMLMGVMLGQAPLHKEKLRTWNGFHDCDVCRY